jgi:hypothetical protein
MRARQECRMRGKEEIERGKENLSFSKIFQKEVKRVEREREKEEQGMARGGEGKKGEIDMKRKILIVVQMNAAIQTPTLPQFLKNISKEVYFTLTRKLLK